MSRDFRARSPRSFPRRREADGEDRPSRHARFHDAMDRFDRFDVPFDSGDDEWDYQIQARERQARLQARDQPPAPKTPLVSDAVLRVLVGDFAPQVGGALNYINESSSARTMATMAGVAAVGLVLPKVLK
jgi:hypothetical protein